MTEGVDRAEDHRARALEARLRASQAENAAAALRWKEQAIVHERKARQLGRL